MNILLPVNFLCVLSVIKADFTLGAKQKLIEKLLTATEKTIQVYQRDYSFVNLDGLFGFRLGQGNVIGALKDCQESRYGCPTSLQARLRQMLDSIGTIGDKALPYVEAQDEKYFNKFKSVIDSPYEFIANDERLGDYTKRPGQENGYDEENGDECLALLMGTSTDMFGKKLPKCTITDQCWTMMTKDNQAKYSITHQLIFFIVAVKENCTSKVTSRLEAMGVTDIRSFQKNLCGSIYNEMKSEVHYDESGPFVNAMQQDIFLEQGSLCGVLGFKDFFRSDWMNMVLSWQTSEGCFKLPDTTNRIVQKISDLDRDRQRLLDMLSEEAKNIEISSSHRGRNLLREQIMKDGCSAHKTGLGFGAITSYLRYIIDNIYK